MYEPTYLPKLNTVPIALSGVRFGINYVNNYVSPDQSNMEPLHIHNYLEIFFNASSRVSFIVNDQLYPVSCGDAVLSQANDIHMCIYNNACVSEHFCLWIDTGPDSPLLPFLKAEHFCPLFSFDDDTQKELRTLLSLLWELCQREGEELKKTATLLQILSVFEDKHQGNRRTIRIPEELQEILKDINNRFTEIHHINEILKSHFISSATLNRWFRNYIHSSPHEYLESKRLSYAVKLLDSGATVTEACMRSGFSDCSHFIVLFKKRFGETPLQYKKRQL